MSLSRGRRPHDRCRQWPSSRLLSRRGPDLGSRSIFCTNPANCSSPNAWHISVRPELHSLGGCLGWGDQRTTPPEKPEGNMSKTTQSTLSLKDSKTWGGRRCLCRCCRASVPCDSMKPLKRDAQGLPCFPAAQLSFQEKAEYKQGVRNQPTFT